LNVGTVHVATTAVAMARGSMALPSDEAADLGAKGFSD
jgi:hypothetical protein